MPETAPQTIDRATERAFKRFMQGRDKRGDFKLTAGQSRFALLIVSGLPGWEAYREAFHAHKTTKRNCIARSAKLLARDDVKGAIQQREMVICETLAVDKQFIVGHLARLAAHASDEKAAVRALELLGRHLEPGFFGDNKPVVAIPTNPAELMKEIGVIIRELASLAHRRGDVALAGLVTDATAELVSIAGPSGVSSTDVQSAKLAENDKLDQ